MIEGFDCDKFIQIAHPDRWRTAGGPAVAECQTGRFHVAFVCDKKLLHSALEKSEYRLEVLKHPLGVLLSDLIDVAGEVSIERLFVDIPLAIVCDN